MHIFNLLIFSLATLSSLPKWLEEKLREHQLEMAEFQYGRGLKTLKDKKVGDIILSIPSTKTLSQSRILGQYPEINQVKSLTETQIIALGIINLRNEKSELVSTLPQQQYSLPLCPDRLKPCLPQTYRTMTNDFQSSYRKVFDQIKSTLSSAQYQKMSVNDYLWAIASTQSRSFRSNNDENSRSASRIMIPGIDLLNHDPNSPAVICYEETTKEYQVRAAIPFKQESEVTISYGMIDNLNLLTNFGFCIPNNPKPLIVFDLEDVLLAAQSLLPNIFLTVIIDNFKIQLRQQKNYPPLLEYNGTDACDNLKQTLTMVKNLAEKLAEISLNDGFEDALLRRLLVRRRKELSNCMSHSNNIEIDEGWEGFLSSIQSLLFDEIKILS